MNRDFEYLTALPGEGREQSWIQRRLETLDVREATALAAATQKVPPEDAAQAINTLQSLDEYKVYFPAGSYKELGQLHLEHDFDVPEEVLPHIDLDKLGRQYEDQHPGLFIGSCYVEYPETAPEPVFQAGGPLPRDNEWSVKMKVASAAVPEGVWVRLPFPNGWEDSCYQCESLTLESLGVSQWSDCTLLEALCVLPEAGNLVEQYDDIRDLFYDGQNLGYVLDEQGQGAPQWRERFAAALELESCRDLRLALDISQNLRCYEWIPSEGLADFAAEHLRSCHVSDELIQSGCIDLDSYAEDLLEGSGYTLTADESGYVARNNRPFIREYTQEPEPMEQSMG